MERSRSPETGGVIFDLGEVLASPTRLYEQLAEMLSTNVESIHDAYWIHRDSHDRGSSPRDYWTSVAREVGVKAVSHDLVTRLSDVDSIAWTSIRPDAESLLRELHESRTTVAILSNAPAALASVARRAAWAPHVDAWFFSGELAIAKPDRRIYELATERLDVQPSSIVFFDDRQLNVTAGLAAGWDAHLWLSGTQMRDVLAQVGIL